MEAGMEEYLIVDDEPEICWVLSRIVVKVGGIARTAPDSKTALELTFHHDFRLAFLDAKLLDRDGLDLAVDLHALKPSMQIVIVSAYFYRHDPTIVAAMQSGLIAGFIAKPFTHAEILSAIASAGNSD